MKKKVLKENKVLTEATGDEPVSATLPPEYTDDPKPFRIRDILDRRVQKQKDDAAAAEEAKRKSELAAKYAGITDKIVQGLETANKPSDVLDDIFNDVVPSSGKADSVGGEIVRAMMRILYRDYNDGDVFYDGYGLETAGPSAEYLMDTVEEVSDELKRIVERELEDDEYTEALEDATATILHYLVDNSHLFGEPNEEDSRDYDTEYLEENRPLTDVSIDYSDDVHELINYDIISTRDIQQYAEDAISDMGRQNGVRPDVEVYGDYISISEITKEMAKEIESWDFWDGLIEEYGEELENARNSYEDDEDEYEEDEEIDESLNESGGFNSLSNDAKTAIKVALGRSKGNIQVGAINSHQFTDSQAAELDKIGKEFMADYKDPSKRKSYDYNGLVSKIKSIIDSNDTPPAAGAVKVDNNGKAHMDAIPQKQRGQSVAMKEGVGDYNAVIEVDGEERRFPFNSKQEAQNFISLVRSDPKKAGLAGKKIGSTYTESLDEYDCNDYEYDYEGELMGVDSDHGTESPYELGEDEYDDDYNFDDDSFEESLKASGIFEGMSDANSSDNVFYESLNSARIPAIKESNEIENESIDFIPDDSI